MIANTPIGHSISNTPFANIKMKAIAPIILTIGDTKLSIFEIICTMAFICLLYMSDSDLQKYNIF